VYNKLFSSILDSSVWLEDNPTRIVWFTFLAAMDEDGFARFAALRNLSGRARVTDDEARAAVAILEAPDPESSDPENDGRRVERVPGGWMILNAPKYRDMVTRIVAREKNRIRVADCRARKRPAECNDLKRSVTLSDTVTESKAETDKIQTREARESVQVISIHPANRLDQSFETACPESIVFSEAHKTIAGRCGESLQSLWESFRCARVAKGAKAANPIGWQADFESWLRSFARNEAKRVSERGMHPRVNEYPGRGRTDSGPTERYDPIIAKAAVAGVNERLSAQELQAITDAEVKRIQEQRKGRVK
jgi:hypothetical protein